MQAMQYAITLPADYDMEIVRRRVATRGASLDALAGLGLKAYLIRERGVAGSPINQYAPFYLWRELTAMNAFLWGEGFRRLSADFGRPRVRQWTGLSFERGPALAAAPRAAMRHLERLSGDADPADAIERALGELRELAATPGAHSAALAIDTSAWQLVRLALWSEAPPPAAPGERYEVLHLSRPELDRLPVGRHWA